MTKDMALICVLTLCAGAYKAEFQGVPAQRRSLAANALASWNGGGGGSQAGAPSAAASAFEQVSPTPLTLQVFRHTYEFDVTHLHLPRELIHILLAVICTL